MMGNDLINELYGKLEGLEPAEAFALINQWYDAVEEVRRRYSGVYTYCGGCHKFIKVAEAKEEREGDKIVTRCPECGIPWHIVKCEHPF